MLATYAYDDLGRRTSVTFGNGGVQTFAYDAVSRLATLTNQPIAGSTLRDLTQTFTYTPSSQISSVTRSNDTYAWQGHYNVDRNYASNGLNQLTAAGSASFTYDARGNLTGDGVNSYTYTAENLLKSSSNGATLAYDPLGRLFETAKSGVAARFMYDGANLIAEYDGNNVLKYRYVHGPGIDNPIVTYKGATPSNLSRRFFMMADERGSIVSESDGTQTTVSINTYDEFGIPGAGNPGYRFGYTGQVWLPEIGMWHYKARTYSPTLGRFLQTDPIGYDDGMNWYNYVSGDPVNKVDPLGLGYCYISGVYIKRYKGISDDDLKRACTKMGGEYLDGISVGRREGSSGHSIPFVVVSAGGFFWPDQQGSSYAAWEAWLRSVAGRPATSVPQNVDRCAAKVTDNPGAQFGGRFEYDPRQALFASLVAYVKHSPGNAAGRSPFGGDVTTPVAVFNAVNLVTPGSFAVRAGNAGRAGYSVRVTAATGMIVGNDRFSGGASTQYITAIFNIDVPAGASKNGLAQAHLVTAYPGCPR